MEIRTFAEIFFIQTSSKNPYSWNENLFIHFVVIVCSFKFVKEDLYLGVGCDLPKYFTFSWFFNEQTSKTESTTLFLNSIEAVGGGEVTT